MNRTGRVILLLFAVAVVATDGHRRALFPTTQADHVAFMIGNGLVAFALVWVLLPRTWEMRCTTLASAHRSSLDVAVAILLLAALVGAAILGDGYIAALASTTAVYSVAALGLRFQLSAGGPASLAHALFFGLGACGTALIGRFLVGPPSLSYALALALALLTGGLAAALIGIVLAGLGYRLALLSSLAVGIIVQYAAHALLGDEILELVRRLDPHRSDFKAVFPLLLTACLAASFGVLFISELWAGRTPIKPIRALNLRSAGEPVGSYMRRLSRFAISGAYCGLAGCLYALHFATVSEAVFSLQVAATLLLSATLVLQSLLSGGIMGAALVVLGTEYILTHQVVTGTGNYASPLYIWPLLLLALALRASLSTHGRGGGEETSPPTSTTASVSGELGGDIKNCRWQVLTRPAPSLLLHEFRGHIGGIAGALELTGGRILSWSDDSSLRIWTHDGQLLRRLDGHVNAVRNACVLANGTILSWGQDWMPRLWSGDGELIRPLVGHEAGVVGMIELPDRRLLSWSGDRTLRIWSEQGEPIAVLRGHLSEVWDCTSMPSGDLLSRGGDDTLRIWSSDGACKGVLECPDGLAPTLLPDGTVLLSGGKTLRMAPGADGTYSISEEEVGRIIPLEDGRCVAGKYATNIHVWLGGDDVYRLLSAHGDVKLKDARPALSGRIVAWDHDGMLGLWTESGTLKRLQKLGQAVEGVAVAADGRMISWGGSNTLRVWSVDLEPQQVLHGHKSKVRGAFLASDGSVLSWGSDPTLCKWAIEGADVPGIGVHEDQILDGHALAAGRLLTRGADRTMRLWSRTGEPVKVMNGKFGGVMQLADGRLLAWHAYSPMTLWTAEGDLIREIDGPGSSSSEVAVLRDGRIVSWGGNQFEIRIWSTEGALLQTLAAHRLAIKSVVELENGTIVSGSSADKTIRIWSRDGKSLRALNADGMKGLIAVAGSRFVWWTYGGLLQFCSPSGESLAAFSNTWVDTAIALRNGAVLTYGSDNAVRIYSPAGKLQRSFEATDKGTRVGRVLERGNGDLLIWGGGTGTRLWSAGGMLRRSIGVFDGAIAFEDATTLLWSKSGRVLLLSDNGKDLCDWTFPNAPLSALVKGTDFGTAWFLHSNAATLARFTDEKTFTTAPQASVIAQPMSTQAMADAIAARSDAAAAYKAKYDALGLDTEADTTALLDFANESQWQAPTLAFRTRRRAARLSLDRVGDKRTMTRVDRPTVPGAEVPDQRSVDQLIEALLKFGQPTHRLGDPHPHLDDDGEVRCWPYKGEREIRHILDELSRSTDPAASSKIKNVISRRLNEYQVYVCLAPLCEALGRLGDGRTAAFLKGLVDVKTNAWEYTRDMKRAAARGLAHLLPRDPNLRDELTQIGNEYGYGVAINRVVADHGLPLISTWDSIAKAAAKDAAADPRWDVTSLSKAIKSYPRERRVSAYAAAAMQFRRQGSRSGAIASYIAALKEEPTVTQNWIWTQLDAVLSHLPKDHEARVLVNSNASGNAGNREAAEKILEAIAEIRT